MPKLNSLTIKLILAAFAVSALSLLGCGEAKLATAVYPAYDGARLAVSVQQAGGVDTQPEFAYLSAASGAGKLGEWTSAQRLHGELAAVLPGDSHTLAVFRAGAISKLTFKDGALATERLAPCPGKVLDAALGNSAPVLLLNDSGNLRLAVLRDGAWAMDAATLAPLDGFSRARLLYFSGKPHVFWLPAVAAAPRLQGAVLEAGEWKYLPPCPVDLGGRAWDLCADADGILLATLPGGMVSAAAAPALHRFHLKGTEWTVADSLTVELDGSPFAAGSLRLCPTPQGVFAAALAQGRPCVFLASPDAGTAPLRAVALPGFGQAQGFFFPESFTLIFLLALLVFTLLQIFRRNRLVARESAQGAGLNFPPASANPFRRFYTPAVGPGGVASPVERALALALDSTLLLPFAVAFMAAYDPELIRLATQDTPLPVLMKKLAPVYAAYELCFIIYATLAEYKFGRTLGKAIFGLQVKSADGSELSLGRVALRNVLRLVDKLPIPIAGAPVYFLPAIVSMLFSRTSQRVGDRMAGTIVCRRVPVSARRIVLASSSPRRKKLLAEMGLGFFASEPDVNEQAPFNTAPEDVAVIIARRKVDATGNTLPGGEVVIAADTIIECEGEIIGKPRDRAHAREILARLSGKTHRVHTGLAVWDRATDRRLSGIETTLVTMRNLSADEISRYIDTGEADDKAGAYGIQDNGHSLIEKIEGGYENVVGLPTGLLFRMLKNLET